MAVDVGEASKGELVVSLKGRAEPKMQTIIYSTIYIGCVNNKVLL